MRSLFRTTAALLAGPFLCNPAPAAPVAAHPDNPRLVSIDGRPTILRTFGEHYSSVIRADFEYIPYLETLRANEFNLTRAFLVGFRENPRAPTADPLAIPPALFLQPWQRVTTGDTALDGLGKWDFTTWNEEYFERLDDFVTACGERGVVVELAFFCTFYTELQWLSSPFHPSNNVQGSGPANRYDCFRPGNNGLLAVQEAVVRETVRRLNHHDNILYNIQNEPFWNEPNVRDSEEIAFHNTLAAALRDEESGLPNRHLLGHNCPPWTPQLHGFDIINEHYPAIVPGSPVRGAENLLKERYSTGKILSLDETDPKTPDQARLEAWMFILGGGAIYNGLDYANLIYHTGDEAGGSSPGPEIRSGIRNLGIFADALDHRNLRRDAAWVASGLPAGATLQAMASPGQQYVAYLHHGVGGKRNFQLAYDPIDTADHTASLTLDLPAGSWRVTWTRPSDLSTLREQTVTHTGGAVTLAPVVYQADAALRIDRTGTGDLTPPPPPRALHATPSADGSVLLEWNPSPAGDVAEYRIYRRDEGTVPADPELPAGTAPVGTTSWRDAGTTPGTQSGYFITAVDTNGNESTPGDPADVRAGLGGTPFSGSPAGLPGTIEAEDFDLGGPGIAYQDHGAGNEGLVYRPDEDVDLEENETSGDGSEPGHHVNLVEPGEWLSFSVTVAEHGVFRPTVRIRAPASGGTWSFALDGSGPAGAIGIPAPEEGSAGEWEEFSGPDIPIAAGDHVVRLTFTGPDPLDRTGAIDRIGFPLVAKAPPVADAGPSIRVTDADLDGWADVPLDGASSTPGDGELVSHLWTVGSTVIADGPVTTARLPVGEHLVRLTTTDEYGLASTSETTVRVINGAFRGGSFENGFDGWETGGSVSIQQAAPYVANDGTRIVAFNNNDLAPGGRVFQTFATVPGGLYELSFDYGILAFNNNAQTIGLEVAGRNPLLAEERTISRLPGSNSRWQGMSVLFTADDDATTITFHDRSAVSQSADLTLDNIRIVRRITRGLAVASAPFDGAEIAITPADNTGMAGGTAPLARAYPNETTVTLGAASSLQGYSFEKWTRDGADFSTSPTIQVLLDDDVSLTAHYVEGPPVILGQPASVVTAGDENVTFSVAASGTGTLVYQWRKDGADITGADQAALTLPAVTTDDEGTYDVVVSNDAGSTTSRPAVLTIRSADAFANGSFEQGFDGWTFTGNVSIQQAGLYTTTDGVNLVAFNNGNSTPDAVLSRVFSTIPGEVYELAFDYGVLAYTNDAQKLGVEVAGDNPLLSKTLGVQRNPGTLTRWLSASHLFTADSALTTLSFRDLSTATNAIDLTLDNIRIIRQVSHSLAVASLPFDGASVTIGTGGSGTTPFVRSHPDQAAVTLTAAPALEGHAFEKWTRDGADFSTSASIQITMTGDVSLTAHYVEGPPVITVQPASIVAAEDADATFSVTAEGTGTLVYQWRRNGADIPGADQPSLTLASVTTEDEGSYDVIVSNNAGATASAAATLGVRSAGEFSNGSFENGFDGWTFSGNLSVREGSPYVPTDGVRNVAFNFGNTTPDGTLSQTFATVPGGIYQLAFDYGVLAYNNSTQTLGVGLAGDGPLLSETLSLQRVSNTIIRWLPASYLFTADSALTTLTFRDLSAGTNALDLTLDNVRVVRRISRTLAVASLPFDGAVVTFGPGDTAEAPFARSYQDGAAVTLAAAPALRGYAFSKWTRGGVDFSTSPSVSVTMDADVSLTAHYVEGPPVITTQPVSVTTAENTDATFTVTAEGTGTLVYQWRRNGTGIPGADQPALQLASVTDGDEGSYDVVVSNGAGSSTSTAATLTIRNAAAFANGSFENGFDGWTVAGNVSIQQQGGLYTAIDGSRIVAFNNGNSVPNGVLSRTFATTAGMGYELAFHFGVYAYNNSQQKLGVELDGAAQLATATYTTQRPAGSNIRWESRSIPFTADGPLTTVTFRDLSAVTHALDLTLDHVRITSVPPQASALSARVPASRIAPAADSPVLTKAPAMAIESGAVRFAWEATKGGRHTLERSADLRDWTVIDETDVEEPGPIELYETAPPKGPVFYRIGHPK